MSFDEYAPTYEQALDRGLRLSGRSADWFAHRRVEVVKDHIASVGATPSAVLEFGCGVGNHVPVLRQAFPGCRIIGVDISGESLRVARYRHGDTGATFHTPTEYTESQSVDLIYVNGVFHHIPHGEHARWLGYFHRILTSKGTLAVFDNNPFSPAARLVMRMIPFDRDAAMVNPYRFTRLLATCGFRVAQRRFHFLFPEALSWLSNVERHLDGLPLGAQYGLLAHPQLRFSEPRL